MKNELMRFYSIIFLLVFSCSYSFGQGEWTFKFNDGNSIKAELTRKGFVSNAKKITYIDKATGKKEVVASKDLSSMTTIVNGQKLVYNKYKMAYRFGEKIKYNPFEYWAAKIYGTDKIEVYLFEDIDGSITATSSYSRRYLAIAFKLTSEEYLIEAGPYTEDDDVLGYKVYSKIMNRQLKNAFMDHCPNFANKLNKKSYYLDEYRKIADDYTAACK